MKSCYLFSKLKLRWFLGLLNRQNYVCRYLFFSIDYNNVLWLGVAIKNKVVYLDFNLLQYTAVSSYNVVDHNDHQRPRPSTVLFFHYLELINWNIWYATSHINDWKLTSRIEFQYISYYRPVTDMYYFSCYFIVYWTIQRLTLLV